MKVLLVEPNHHRVRSAGAEARRTGGRSDIDDTLWYPPLGLMKLSRFHRNRGDTVKFVRGCAPELAREPELFDRSVLWDRVYISTLFTFNWQETIRTIDFYRSAVGGTKSKIFVGGIMASLMEKEIFEETGIQPTTGVLTSPQQIGLPGNDNIDMLPPDYDLVDNQLYAISDTYYGYTTRGCISRCPWCGVPKIEPRFIPYIDIKKQVLFMRRHYGDKSKLKLMDNNILASDRLQDIVSDLVYLGYGRDTYTETKPPRQRSVDFNQGLDASLLDEFKMKLLSRLNIKPMRFAFDRMGEKKAYMRSMEFAHKYGVRNFSTYMLYNFTDSPKDLYDRLLINIKINEKWGRGRLRKPNGSVYSYPMRYAPINDIDSTGANRRRDYVAPNSPHARNSINPATWTRRFLRNVEIMKGAAHGAISTTPSLAHRTIGRNYTDFLENLCMPEVMLRNRNLYEGRIYGDEPVRKKGSGDVENFRKFIRKLLRKHDDRSLEFYKAISENSKTVVRDCLKTCKSAQIKKWLRWYVKKGMTTR